MLNTKTSKSVNKTSKSLLAKCMATEDIRVEHSKEAETAAFDIKNRCLVLPIWKDMSNSMYDMLVAHEVSHALNTPFQEWEDARKTVNNQGAFMQVANVVEDARIERMIKSQYPGIRKDFARAYGELNDSDLFEIAGKDLSEMNLIDRLNVHFKLGLFGHVQVPFSADEQSYVTRMEETETFTDVVELAKELLTDWESQQPEQQPQDGENGESGDEGESQDGQGQNGQGQNADNGDSQSETSESSADAGDDAETQQGSGDNGTPMDTPNIDDLNGQNDDNNDGGEKRDGQDGEDEGLAGYDDYTNNSGGLPSQTQTAFEQGKKQFIDEDAKSQRYNTLPTSMNLDKIIVDSDAVDAIWDEHEARIQKSDAEYGNTQFESYQNRTMEMNIDCDKFLTSKKAVINHMVSQFQMKQSADADRRTSISRSGVLDTTAMMSYKWNEEIFASNEVIADGKNHGMVFFLDWSGSMGSIIKDTVEQLFILTEFCNKVNIPFEVYAFSDRDDLQPEDVHASVEYIPGGEEIHTHPQYNVREGASTQIRPHTFSLINFVSSKMNKKQYKNAVRRLYQLAVSRYGSTPRQFSLGCTPLNEAVVSAFDIVPKFQEENGVQIVNAVFLTDGEGHGMGCRSGLYCDQLVHDPITKMDYSVVGYETDCYLQILKDRTGCNVVGIFLTNQKHISNLRYRYLEDSDIASATKTYSKSNYAVASDSKTGYDELYIVKGNIGNDDDALDSLGEDASYAKIRNAFKKNASGTKTNKIIATKMIEVFASTLVK